MAKAQKPEQAPYEYLPGDTVALVERLLEETKVCIEDVRQLATEADRLSLARRFGQYDLACRLKNRLVADAIRRDREK